MWVLYIYIYVFLICCWFFGFLSFSKEKGRLGFFPLFFLSLFYSSHSDKIWASERKKFQRQNKEKRKIIHLVFETFSLFCFREWEKFRLIFHCKFLFLILQARATKIKNNKFLFIFGWFISSFRHLPFLKLLSQSVLK